MSDVRRQDSYLRVIEEQSGSAVLYLTRCMHGRATSDYDIHSIKFRNTFGDGSEVMAIIGAFDDAGGPVVAFHSASNFGETVVGVAKRLRNGSLKWRTDEYYRKAGD